MDKLYKIFFSDPNKEYHVRGIAKMIKISPTSASKYLKGLEKNGIIKSEKKYGHLIFKADTESKKYKTMKRNYNLSSLYESGLIEHLEKAYNHPEAIVLFGSFSRAEDIERSDIDILVITSLKRKLNLTKYREILQKDVQIFEISKEEFKKTNTNLKNNWINGIVLEGYLEI